MTRSPQRALRLATLRGICLWPARVISVATALLVRDRSRQVEDRVMNVIEWVVSDVLIWVSVSIVGDLVIGHFLREGKGHPVVERPLRDDLVEDREGWTVASGQSSTVTNIGCRKNGYKIPRMPWVPLPAGVVYPFPVRRGR
jgi:hypothetical protein